MTDNSEETEQLSRTAKNTLLTPSELISKTIDILRAAEGTDVALLDILSKNILLMNSGDTAVDNAVAEIARLADERAAVPDDE